MFLRKYIILLISKYICMCYPIQWRKCLTPHNYQNVYLLSIRFYRCLLITCLSSQNCCASIIIAYQKSYRKGNCQIAYVFRKSFHSIGLFFKERAQISRKSSLILLIAKLYIYIHAYRAINIKHSIKDEPHANIKGCKSLKYICVFKSSSTQKIRQL